MTYNNVKKAVFAEQLHGWWMAGVFWSDVEVETLISMFPAQQPQTFKKLDIRNISLLQKALNNFLIQMPDLSPGEEATLALTSLGIELVSKYA